jgi:hypothetical protein
MNHTRKGGGEQTCRDLNKWYSKMFEKLGYLVLAKEDGTSDKMAHYKMTLTRLCKALKDKKVVDKDKRKDLDIMRHNVELLLDHVNKHF